MVALRDVPRRGNYADALKQTAARLRQGPLDSASSARIGREADTWDRTEYFPVDAYWKGATRLHEAGVDLLSCVSISRSESRATLDLLTGRPAATPPEAEAMLLLDMAPDDSSSHRL